MSVTRDGEGPRMVKLKGAHFSRMVQRDARRLAEVRIQVEGQPHEFIAMIGKSGSDWYDIPLILRNDADYSIDWYDNDLHQAFRDMDAEFTVADKHRLIEEILSFPEVQQRVQQELS